MTKYDTSSLATDGRSYQRIRAEMEAVRGRITAEIPKALRAGVPQVEITRLTGMTRERVRQIARAAGVGGQH